MQLVEFARRGFPDEFSFDVDMAQAVNITPQHIHECEVHDAAFQEPIFPQAPIPGWGGGECAGVQATLHEAGRP